MRSFLPVLLALCCLLPARAVAEDAGVDGTPPRVLLGMSGQVGEMGTLRFTLAEAGLGQELALVPYHRVEIFAGNMVIFTGGGSWFWTGGRVSVLPFEEWHLTVGGGWSQQLPLFQDLPTFHAGTPFATMAGTWVHGDWRVNLAAEYFFVGDHIDESYGKDRLESKGLDDLVLHVGVEWRVHRLIRLFLEPTLVLPIPGLDATILDEEDEEDDDFGATKWDLDTVPLQSLLVGYGARLVAGRWNVELALIKAGWAIPGPSLAKVDGWLYHLGLPWLSGSVTFDIF
jgi:hypothetical protein